MENRKGSQKFSVVVFRIGSAYDLRVDSFCDTTDSAFEKADQKTNQIVCRHLDFVDASGIGAATLE